MRPLLVGGSHGPHDKPWRLLFAERRLIPVVERAKQRVVCTGQEGEFTHVDRQSRLLVRGRKGCARREGSRFPAYRKTTTLFYFNIDSL